MIFSPSSTLILFTTSSHCFLFYISFGFYVRKFYFLFKLNCQMFCWANFFFASCKLFASLRGNRSRVSIAVDFWLQILDHSEWWTHENQAPSARILWFLLCFFFENHRWHVRVLVWAIDEPTERKKTEQLRWTYWLFGEFKDLSALVYGIEIKSIAWRKYLYTKD